MSTRWKTPSTPCASTARRRGDNVDICIEIHRQLTPAEAIVLAKGIEEFHPMFYEDPTLPDNLDAMALIASKISIPIATGERIHSIHEFQMLLQRNAVQYVRPDVCMAGGLTHSKKIAALAGGAVRRRDPTQPARPGEHGGLPPACRVHPQTSPSRNTHSASASRPRARSSRHRCRSRTGS